MTLTKTSNLTALFSIINSAKNIREYSIANAAFAVLLYEVLYRDDIKIQYESQEINGLYIEEYQNNITKAEVIEHYFCIFQKSRCEDYQGDWLEIYTYYDLITISDGLRDVCIPVPLLKPGVAKACFEDARERGNFISKREHNRSHSPNLPGQRDYLLKELEKIAPNWSELTDKYLANKIEKEEIPANYFLCNMHGYEEGLAKDVTTNIYRVDDDRRGHCTFGMHGSWYADYSPSHSGDIQIIPMLF